RLEPCFPEREGRVHAAVVELDALADAVRAAAQDHDLPRGRRIRLALLFITGVHVGRVARELRGAAVHSLEDRSHVFLVTCCSYAGFLDLQQLRDPPIAEALALEPPQRLGA